MTETELRIKIRDYQDHLDHFLVADEFDLEYILLEPISTFICEYESCPDFSPTYPLEISIEDSIVLTEEAKDKINKEVELHIEREKRRIFDKIKTTRDLQLFKIQLENLTKI